MEIAWQAYGLGRLAKRIHGHYLAYRNFDNEIKASRWFAKFGEVDSLEDAQAFCDKNALDVERRGIRAS